MPIDDNDDSTIDEDDDDAVYLAFRYVYALAEGGYFVAVPEGIRDEIVHQLDALRGMLLASDTDVNLIRLFPGAYEQDPDREVEYQRLMRGELIESRLAAFDTLEQTMKEQVVSEPDLHQWLMALNAVRLVLASIIDIDDDEFELAPDDPRYPTYIVYCLCTEIMHDVYTALRAGGALDRS